MGDLEAIGDAVTGGVVGRAVESRAGEPADGHSHETNCLNCGAALAGPYCHECGQHAHVHRTLSAFGHDFLHGVLHFEGKIWRTLPMLVWRPGALTRRYIDGQRATFVSPIALFLFCVFLTFAVMGLTGTHLNPMPPGGKREISDELKADRQALAELQARRAEAAKRGRSTKALDDKITDENREIATLQAIAEGRAPPSSAIQVDTDTDLPGFLEDVIGSAKKNPELLFYKLKTNAYKFSWALIPISVPFVWLLFPFSRRFRIYDHTVFVTYSLCFMMLLLSAATLVGLVSSIAAVAWLVPPLHMYRQLRGTYGVSAFGAVWRTLALTIFAFVAISLFVSLLVTLGAFD